MGDLLATLASRHPGLVVEVTTDDALVDIVREGYDAGVRLGEMIAEDMTGRSSTAAKTSRFASRARLG